MFHIALHFLIPAFIATVFFRQHRLRAMLLMSSTMLVDLDHLVANPIYDANRCSIGFHPLHKLPLIPFYLILAAIPATRLIGLGLLTHMALDSTDCMQNTGQWIQQ